MCRLPFALIVTVSAIGFAHGASAADMPVKAPVSKAPVIVPYNWTGFYVGANAGYTWGPWDASSSQVIFDPSTTHSPKVNGWLAGLQGGYNWQSGAWVYGLEGDIQITGAKDSDAWSAPGAPPVIINNPAYRFPTGSRGLRPHGIHARVEVSLVWNATRSLGLSASRALASIRDGRSGSRRGGV